MGLQVKSYVETGINSSKIYNKFTLAIVVIKIFIIESINKV